MERFLSHHPAHAHPHPKGGASLSPKRLTGAAGPARPISLSVGALAAVSGLWWILGRPCDLSHCSPLLTFRLLKPAGEVIDSHILELKEMLQAPHLHLEDLHGLL